jgi:hypothetical protein
MAVLCLWYRQSDNGGPTRAAEGQNSLLVPLVKEEEGKEEDKRKMRRKKNRISS